MLPQELPEFLRQLNTHHAALDPMHLMYDNVLKSGYLHFGYWPDRTSKAHGIMDEFCSRRSAMPRS